MRSKSVGRTTEVPRWEWVQSKLHALLPRLRAQYGVRHLALFGSVVRGEAHQQSDINIIVDLEAPLGLRFFTLLDELERALHRRVDLITYENLRLDSQIRPDSTLLSQVEQEMIDVAEANR